MDLEARILGAVGAVGSAIGIALTLVLWHRSGPLLRVKVVLPAGTQRIRIRVANVGRLPAVVRRVELRDRFVVSSPQQTKIIPRWVIALAADDNQTPFPITLSPTESRDFYVELEELQRRLQGVPEATVDAWVLRTDDKWFSSKDLKIEFDT